MESWQSCGVPKSDFSKSQHANVHKSTIANLSQSYLFQNVRKSNYIQNSHWFALGSPSCVMPSSDSTEFWWVAGELPKINAQIHVNTPPDIIIYQRPAADAS
jgi:hypothetical protein